MRNKKFRLASLVVTAVFSLVVSGLSASEALAGGIYGPNVASGYKSCKNKIENKVGNLWSKSTGYVTHVPPGSEYRDEWQNYNSFEERFSIAKTNFYGTTIWGGGRWELSYVAKGAIFKVDCQSFG